MITKVINIVDSVENIYLSNKSHVGHYDIVYRTYLFLFIYIHMIPPYECDGANELET